jgi:hypothetical protein
MTVDQDVLTLDPIAMNVVNRVAAGSDLHGDLAFDGGLLVQGSLSGTVHVHGSLIVWAGATVSGRLRVAGDFYLFGRLGAPGEPVSSTTLECLGQAYVASSGVSTGTLLARRLQLYEGADLQGPFKTLRGADNIPVLHEAVVPAAEVNPERP